MVWPFMTRPLMVAPAKLPLPVKPTSQLWPCSIGSCTSQLGFEAVRSPSASAGEMLPFQAWPGMEAEPSSRKTTWNDVIGAEKESLVTRTAPLNPPCHVLVVTTSTVTPPADTAKVEDPVEEVASSCPSRHAAGKTASRPSISSRPARRRPAQPIQASNPTRSVPNPPAPRPVAVWQPPASSRSADRSAAETGSTPQTRAPFW
jgi:hypothetical protein